MKKLYIITLCMAVCASGGAAGNHFKTKRSTQRKAIAKTERAEKLWRPASQTEYMYDGEGWMLLGTTEFTYDNRGNAISTLSEDEDGTFKSVTEYDDNNMPVSIINTSDSGDGWENDSKRTYVYDPVLHDYFTERLGYDWNGTDWVRNYLCETNTITRNDKGGITEIVKSLPIFDNLAPAYKAVWNYDEATGMANAFSYYVNTSGDMTPLWELNDDISYHNIVWAETDGQMTEASMYDFLSGKNRISSCEVRYMDETDGYFFVEYPADKPGEYFAKETYNDPTVIGATTRLEILDANGSYRITDCEYFDEDGNPTTEPTYIGVQDFTIDEHGNLVLEERYETYEESVNELMSSTKYDYTYDENGNVKELVIAYYDFDAEGYIPDSKIEYGEYTDVSAGVDNIAVDKAVSATVYNLQGIPVLTGATAGDLDSLPAGIYIFNGKKHLVR